MNPLILEARRAISQIEQKHREQDNRIEKVRRIVKDLSEQAISDDGVLKILQNTLAQVSMYKHKDRIVEIHPTSKL